MDQIINNLKVIEKKILQAQELWDEETAYAWKEQSALVIAQLSQHFAHLGKPLSIMEQLYKNWLEH